MLSVLRSIFCAACENQVSAGAGGDCHPRNDEPYGTNSLARTLRFCPPPYTLSIEDQLKAIIEAQVNGGCRKFKRTFNSQRPRVTRINYLEILLDPAGLQAAYGDEWIELKGRGYTMKVWEYNAEQILRAWLHEGLESAIETAFSLLPKPQ